jgi:hypothetical protein
MVRYLALRTLAWTGPVIIWLLYNNFIAVAPMNFLGFIKCFVMYWIYVSLVAYNVMELKKPGQIV